MKYEKIIKAKFKDRPNRFIAVADIDGKEVKAHVKNTGRCRELLIPGATVYLQDFRDNMRSRKLEYSLIAVEKINDGPPILVNMDSQVPNKVVKEALEEGLLQLGGLGKLCKIKSEAVYGNSRIDFYVEDEVGRGGYIEVKGVTLEKEKVALFPDAPTERGIKHLTELENAVRKGKAAAIIFVIQMKGIKKFMPNDEGHKAFGDALRSASQNGVEVMAFDCIVTKDSIQIDDRVEVCL